MCHDPGHGTQVVPPGKTTDPDSHTISTFPGGGGGGGGGLGGGGGGGDGRLGDGGGGGDGRLGDGGGGGGNGGAQVSPGRPSG